MTTRNGQRRNPESEEREQRIAELFTTLSHELRTPLATIKGYTTMLLRHAQLIAPEEQQDFLQAIQGAANHLEVLMNRLFDVAQLETGAMSLNTGVIDIPSLARETIATARQWVPESLQAQTTFHLHLKDAAGSLAQEVPPVRGDVRRLREVFEYLLENAVHFSPEGGRIDVLVRPVPHLPHTDTQDQSQPAQPFLETCICDYGIGIPPEHLEHIFDCFHRVDTRLTREVNGLGLGLTLCRHLITLHQGRIWAESCPAGGSAFHVWLPIAEPEPAL